MFLSWHEYIAVSSHPVHGKPALLHSYQTSVIIVPFILLLDKK